MYSQRKARAKRVFIHVLILYSVLLSLLCFSPWLQRQIIYLHWVQYPFMNVSDPSLFTDLYPIHTSSLFLHTADNIRLGAWHLCLSPPCQFSNQTTVFLYFHGNAGHRGTSHRIEIYKKLLSIKPNAHILTFDYRGYGDSDFQLPTNVTMQLDAFAAWEYLLNQGVSPSQIHFVAHSLGTGISTKLASQLFKKPSSILLFAPYTDLATAATAHPLLLAVPFLAKPFIVDHFDNYSINQLELPILIIHGTWDLTIPVSHSHALIDSACPLKQLDLFFFPKHGSLKICKTRDRVMFFERSRTGHNLGIDGLEAFVKSWLNNQVLPPFLD